MMQQVSDAVDRPDWRDRIGREWRDWRVVWLAAPGRLGKTTLGRSLPGIDILRLRSAEHPSRCW